MKQIYLKYKSGYKEIIQALSVQFKTDHLYIEWSDGTPCGYNVDRISYEALSEIEVQYDIIGNHVRNRGAI